MRVLARVIAEACIPCRPPNRIGFALTPGSLHPSKRTCAGWLDMSVPKVNISNRVVAATSKCLAPGPSPTWGNKATMKKCANEHVSTMGIVVVALWRSWQGRCYTVPCAILIAPSGTQVWDASRRRFSSAIAAPTGRGGRQFSRTLPSMATTYSSTTMVKR